MNDYLLYDYLPGFANTVTSELGVAILFGLWSLRQLSSVALVNIISHPSLHLFLWSAFWWHEATPPLILLLGLEVIVVLVEGLLLWRLLRLWPGKAIGLAAAMNTVSCLVGLAVAP